MVQKVLVLGGTRFFGKKLVQQLVHEQLDVTILTRGHAENPFGNSVRWLQSDRTDPVALHNALGGLAFDTVYDNICFTAQEAAAAAELFAGRAKRYIVTSSLAVYPLGGPPKWEDNFNPMVYPIPEPFPDKCDYAEGKRLVEAVLFRDAPFPVAAVRFPIVLGLDDYTRRLHFHVERIMSGQVIGIPNLDARMSFITSDEAASFLAWLGRSSLEGPINACSKGEMSLERIISLIEHASGSKAIIRTEAEPEGMSPFGVPESWCMDTTKANEAGFSFSDVDDWMPRLIEDIVQLNKK